MKLGEGSTPGPWKIVRADKVQHAWEDNPPQIVVDDPIFGETAIVTMGRDQPRDANARLIAKAPLLIEARALIAHVIGVFPHSHHKDKEDQGCLQCQARALLAKLDAE